MFPSTHPCRPRELPTKGHLPPPHPLPLYICKGVQSLALGRALDLGRGHLSQCLHQLALDGWGAGMPMQPVPTSTERAWSSESWGGGGVPTFCLSLGCPNPHSPPLGTRLIPSAKVHQSTTDHKLGMQAAGEWPPGSQTQAIQPWAHLVAQVIGMRWVA